jgi:hypothetical protein
VEDLLFISFLICLSVGGKIWPELSLDVREMIASPPTMGFYSMVLSDTTTTTTSLRSAAS